MSVPFAGFTPQTLEFYRGLKQHNEQKWFEQHRESYLNDAMTPAQALVMEMGLKLQELRPGIRFNPDFNGKGSIKKIHTDRRFNPDRDPYKTWLDIIFWEGPLKTKKDNSVAGLRLTTDELMLFVGLKHFEPPVLKTYREAVADDNSGDELEKITTKLSKREYEIHGKDGYVKVPRGYSMNHPRAELLRHNAIYAIHREQISDIVYSSKLVAYVLKHYKAMMPLHAWCVYLISRLG